MSHQIEPSQPRESHAVDDEPVARALEVWRQLPKSEREAWLDNLGQGHPTLAAEVRSVVGYVDQNDFLNQRASNFVLACNLDSDSDLAAGRQVGPYRLVRQLGEGGHGLVWSAINSDGQAVAMKFLKTGLFSDSARRRFMGEQHVMKGLDHPSISKLLDAGTTEAGVPYLVLELVDGQDVLSHCDSHGLDLSARVRLVVQALRGLEAAHSRGIVHRDIKPTNMLVAGDQQMPRLRLIDFGIAKFDDARGTASDSLTVTGQALGTTNYMSPEQIADGAKDIDAASDIYSTAVVLYELLTGRLPYDPQLLERSPADAIRHSLPLSLLGWDKPISRSLESVLARALRKEPRLRFSSARAFAEALEACLEGQSPESAWGRRGYAVRHFARRYWLPLAAVALLLAGMSVATAVSTRWALIAERERDAAEFSTYRTTLSGVTKAIEAGDLEAARVLLGEAPVSQRGPEWTWLSSMASGAQEIWNEETAVRTLVAADQGWLVGLMSGEMVRLDDAGKVLWRAKHASSPLSSIAVRAADSGAGSMIVSGHANGTMVARTNAMPTEVAWSLSLDRAVIGIEVQSQRGWIAATSNALYRIDGSGIVLDCKALPTEVTALAANEDATAVFLGTVDGRIQSLVEQDAHWTVAWQCQATQSPVAAMAYMPATQWAGASVWASDLQREVKELCAEDGRSIGVGLPRPGKIVSIAVEPDTGTLALGMQDGSVGVLRRMRTEPTTITRDHGRMARVAFRGRLLASAGWDGSVRLRVVDQSAAIARADSLGSPVVLAWDTQGNACAAWRSASDTSKLVMRVEAGAPRSVSLDAIITAIAGATEGWLVGTMDGAVTLVGVDGKASRLSQPDGIASACVATGTQGEVWKASDDGRCFRVADGSVKLIAQAGSGRLSGMIVMPQGSESVAMHGVDGVIREVSVDGVRSRASLGEHLINISPNATATAWAGISASGTKLLWTAEPTWRPRSILVEDPASAGPAWVDPNGRIAIGHASGHVSIVDSRRASQIVRLRVSDVAIRSLTCDHKGRLLVLDDLGVIRTFDTQ